MWGQRIKREADQGNVCQMVDKNALEWYKVLKKHRIYKKFSYSTIFIKDDTVVEYALSRSLSPTAVAEYSTNLIDKNLLENKLIELRKLLDNNGKDD